MRRPAPVGEAPRRLPAGAGGFARPNVKHKRGLVWFRRDLRLDDHAALRAAAAECAELAAVFVLDPRQLAGDRIGPPNVQFFFGSLAELRADVRAAGSDLAVLRGDFADELAAFAEAIGAEKLYFNVDYEPAAIVRDRHVRERFRARGRDVESFTDHVYFGNEAIRKDDGSPYTVFTPFKRRWMERLEREAQTPYASREAAAAKWIPAKLIGETRPVPEPAGLGYEASPLYPQPGAKQAKRMLDAFIADRIGSYDELRNVPQRDATSRLSPHLRAGTIGIRTCVTAALEARRAGKRTRGADVWLSELIWREFYQSILANFPYVADGPFIQAAGAIPWRDDDAGFEAWCGARTGYPIVDAAMRQLTATGWMHNRLRMIVASFLTKDLLIDWRRGERFFERWLADADLAANNGGWQWSASTGTDAAPYFRVFNPILQSEKFDPGAEFIGRMLPELARLPAAYRHAPWLAPPLALAEAQVTLPATYPLPIVDHAVARTRTLAAFAPILGAKADLPGRTPTRLR